MDNLPRRVLVKWADSYGVEAGWKDLSDYSADELIIESLGFIIFENEKVIALAHNYSFETDNTPEQANGIMVIPKRCITDISVI